MATSGDLVQLWNPDTGQVVKELAGYRGYRLAFITSPQGHPLVAIVTGSDLILWNAHIDEVIHPFSKWAEGYSAITHEATLGVDHEGHPVLATPGFDAVRLWNPITGQQTGELKGHYGAHAAAFGVDNQGNTVLATAGYETVTLWNLGTSEVIGRPIKDRRAAAYTIAFGSGAGGQPLFAIGGQGSVRLLSANTGSLLTRLKHSGAVRAMAFGETRAGLPLLAAADSRSVKLWRLDNSEVVHYSAVVGPTESVNSIAFGADRSGRVMLATASDDRSIRLWDLESRCESHAPFTDRPWALSATFGTDRSGNPLLATVHLDSIRIWDTQSGQLVHQLVGIKSWVESLAFGKDRAGSLAIVTLHIDDSVQMWNPDTGDRIKLPVRSRIRRRFERHILRRNIYSSQILAADRSGRLLLASNDGRGVRLWNPLTGKSIGRLCDRTYVFETALGVNGSGRHLLAIRGTDTIEFWDPETSQPIGRPVPRAETSQMALGSDSRGHPVLATADLDRTIRLWNPTTGEPIGVPLTGNTHSINTLAFGTDRTGNVVLATGGDDRTVRIWRVDSGKPLTVIQRRAAVIRLAASGNSFAIIDAEGLFLIELTA